jgi:ubiquinone/menaquinone biosynthesis C-methylase UbiE
VDESGAVELLAPAISRGRATWLELGAGHGTFTLALVELLGPDGRVFAIDRNARALAALRRRASRHGDRVATLVADFTQPFDLTGFAAAGLDGLLAANALHFAPDPGPILTRVAAWLRPRGRLVVVEYEGRAASRWVPHPIPASRLEQIAVAAGFAAPVVLGSRPSAYGGSLYVAAADRRDP